MKIGAEMDGFPSGASPNQKLGIRLIFHRQTPDGLMKIIALETRSSDDDQTTNVEDIGKAMPEMKFDKLVGAHDEVEFLVSKTRFQFQQGIDGIGGLWPFRLDQGNGHVVAVGQSGFQHGYSVPEGGDGLSFMGWISGRDEKNQSEIVPEEKLPGDPEMPFMDRVKGAAQ